MLHVRSKISMVVSIHGCSAASDIKGPCPLEGTIILKYIFFRGRTPNRLRIKSPIPMIRQPISSSQLMTVRNRPPRTGMERINPHTKPTTSKAVLTTVQTVRTTHFPTVTTTQRTTLTVTQTSQHTTLFRQSTHQLQDSSRHRCS